MICSLRMSGRKRQDYLKQVADKITYAQQRNAQARKSHRKQTIRRLQAIGIKGIFRPGSATKEIVGFIEPNVRARAEV